MGIGCCEEKEYSKKLLEVENMIAGMKTSVVESEDRTEISQNVEQKQEMNKKIGKPMQEVHYPNNRKTRKTRENGGEETATKSLKHFLRIHGHTVAV